jgi:hypothetical protein
MSNSFTCKLFKFFKMPKAYGIVPIKLFEARYMQDKKKIQFLLK